MVTKENPGKRFCIPQCLRQVTGGSAPCSGTDGRFSQATESRWGSSSFKAHQRGAPGQQEDKPGKLQLGSVCPAQLEIELSPHALATPACLQPQRTCTSLSAKLIASISSHPGSVGWGCKGGRWDMASQELVGKQLLLPRPFVGAQLWVLACPRTKGSVLPSPVPGLGS